LRPKRGPFPLCLKSTASANRKDQWDNGFLALTNTLKKWDRHLLLAADVPTSMTGTVPLLSQKQYFASSYLMLPIKYSFVWHLITQYIRYYIFLYLLIC
jgi:hypothetical protein